jgi:endoglucanase
MEEKKNSKWMAIAVCEAVLICVVIVVAVALFMKKDEKTVTEVNATTPEVQKETQEVSNVKQGTEDKKQETSAAETVTEKATTEVRNLQKNDGNVTVAFTQDTAWESGDSQFAQYTLVLENNMEDSIASWEYTLEVPETAKLNSYWGCNIEQDGQTAKVTPVTYTAEIEAGGQLSEGVGIIVEWKKDTEFNIASGDFAFSLPEEETTENMQEESNAQTTSQIKAEPESGTPVANHGGLSVNGTDLVDEGGSKFQLKGVSTHGIGWFPQYVTKETFQTLRDDFNVNTIRLAMYTAEGSGYCTGGNKTELKKLVENGVEYATELGMYVIIDWHVLNDNNPNTYKSEAIEFFQEMSKKYASYDNVLYEICNEPNGATTWADVKSYATDVISEIRKNDSDAVILVGTPTWSQDVDAAAADRIANDENVMYVLHFYAATHKDDLRNKLVAAHKAGLPVFISEFSICDASGNGSVDYDSASKWLSLIQDYNISYVGWNLSNKAESSALLKSSCTKISGFSESDLSETGKWLFESFSK